MLKAALICAGVVSVEQDAPPLSEQLMASLGAGLHVSIQPEMVLTYSEK